MSEKRDDEDDYPRIIRELEQKRKEWDLAKSGATTDEQKAAVDKRYAENIKLMEKERDDIRAAKPGQARLHEFRQNARGMTRDDRER